MIHAVFLSYYPQYIDQGLPEFERILSDLNLNSSLTIVNNNQATSAHLVSHRVIRGDNTNWEFSGWDSALDVLPPLAPDDYLLLCNDTFNQHRVWSSGDRSRFVSAFIQLLENKGTGMSGEVHQLKSKQTFSVLGRSVDRWVSTYLFGMSSNIITENRFRLSLPEDVLNNLFLGYGPNGMIFSDELSKNVQEHIKQWMNPNGGATSWYKAKTATYDIRTRKIKTILNEMYLAAQCGNNGGVFFNAAPMRPLRGLIRIRNLITGRRARYAMR